VSDLPQETEKNQSTNVDLIKFTLDETLKTLHELIRDDCFVTEQTVSRTLSSLGDLRPFQMRNQGEKLYVCLPSNIIDLITKNYLVKLFMKSCEMRNAIFIDSTEEYESKLEITDLLGKLHGLSAVLLHKIKPYSKELKGEFKAGLYCGLKAYLQAKGKVDIRIFKFFEALRPNELLLSSAWGDRYPVEKQMIDSVLYCIHRNDLDFNTLKTYLRSVGEVEKLYGISRKVHENKVLSHEEHEFIMTDYKKVLEQEIHLDFKSYENLLDVQDNLIRVAKRFKKYKDLCSTLIDTRMRVLYSDKKNKKVRKQSIETLIDSKKGSLEYMNAFSPCRAIGLTITFRVGKVPSDEKEYTAVLNELSKFIEKHQEGFNDKTRLDFLYNWFNSELNR